MHRPSLVLCMVLALFSFFFIGCGGANNSSSASNPSPSPSGSQPGSAGSGSGSSSGSGSGSGSGGSPSGGGSTLSALAFVTSGNQIYGIAVDSANNVSTAPGSPNSVTGQRIWLATSGRLLFANGANASDPSSDNITSYRADANGSLTKLANIVAKGASTIATDTSGNFLYASADVDANNQGFAAPAMYGYAIDQSSGTLTALPGSPWQINHGAFPAELKVTSTGAYVCVNMVLFKGNEQIQCYPRHSDGIIDSQNYVVPFSTDGDLPGFDATADGTHLVFSDGARNMVHSAPIANASSSLEIPSGGSYSNGVAVYPGSPQTAVVTNRDSGSVTVVELGTNASMAGGPSTAAGNQPNRLAFSDSGFRQLNYLFVSTKDGTLVFSFDPDTRALKPLNGNTLAPGTGVLAIMHMQI